MSVEQNSTNEVVTINAEHDTPAIVEGQGSRADVQSRHSSTTYPYRSLMDETSFARCQQVSALSCSSNIYTRSLLRSGNGTPLWDPVGNVIRREHHLKSSAMIGDVGRIDIQGDFSYFFNIFLPPTHPAQSLCPKNLEPLLPPLDPSELIIKPDHFPAGTTFVSPGVEYSCASTSPLDMTFTVNAREGGILLLPDGASREDLVSTDRVRDYVLKHARDWYDFLNEGIEYRVLCPNGSLCVVTGHDKATSWGACASPPYNGTGEKRTIRYTEEAWTSGSQIDAHESGNVTTEFVIDHCALFLRTMRVALSEQDWAKHILKNSPPETFAFYYMPTVPIFGLRSLYQRLKERTYMKRPEDRLSNSADCSEHAFHPLTVVLQFLLIESPSSRMAVIEDPIWNAVASTTDGSLSSLSRALVDLLLSHEISKENGYVTLKPLSTSTLDGKPPTSSPKGLFNVPHHLMSEIQKKRKRMAIASKLSKIFPGPGLPSDYVKRAYSRY